MQIKNQITFSFNAILGIFLYVTLGQFVSWLHFTDPLGPGQMIKHCLSGVWNLRVKKCLNVERLNLWPSQNIAWAAKTIKSCCVMFLKRFKSISAWCEKRMFDEQYFATWPNGKNIMLDNQIANVWQTILIVLQGALYSLVLSCIQGDHV